MLQNTSLISRADGVTPMEGLGTQLNRCKNIIRGYYDFAVQGGAYGATLLALKDDQGNNLILPKGALIVRSWTRTVTALTSGGSATLAIQVLTANDILTATAYSSFSGADVCVEGISTGAASLFKGPMTGVIQDFQGNMGNQVSAVIATAAITAGKVAVYIEYVL